MSSKHNTISEIAGAVLLTSISLVAPASFAADWYSATVYQVVPRAQEDGDVFVQINPAPGESRWTGTARVIIDGTAPGASKLMNTLLAGMVLNKVVTVNTDAIPSFATPQIVNSAGLIGGSN